jgi:hypothetical protein
MGTNMISDMNINMDMDMDMDMDYVHFHDVGDQGLGNVHVHVEKNVLKIFSTVSFTSSNPLRWSMQQYGVND